MSTNIIPAIDSAFIDFHCRWDGSQKVRDMDCGDEVKSTTFKLNVELMIIACRDKCVTNHKNRCSDFHENIKGKRDESTRESSFN